MSNRCPRCGSTNWDDEGKTCMEMDCQYNQTSTADAQAREVVANLNRTTFANNADFRTKACNLIRREIVTARQDAYHNGYQQGQKEEREAKDQAYTERNKVVALLARCFPSGIAKTDIPGWDAEWHGCVYIDLPTGQSSWHFHDDEKHLFGGLPPYWRDWDGHTTDDKYQRLRRMCEIIDSDPKKLRLYEAAMAHSRDPNYAIVDVRDEAVRLIQSIAEKIVEPLSEGNDDKTLRQWRRELNALLMETVRYARVQYLREQYNANGMTPEECGDMEPEQ